MTKRTYTVEITYMLPVYKHVEVQAASAAQACELALQDDDWDLAEHDYDSSGADHVTGIWLGSKAYQARSFRVPIMFQNKEKNALELISGIVASDFVQNDFIGRCKAILSPAKQDAILSPAKQDKS